MPYTNCTCCLKVLLLGSEHIFARSQNVVACACCLKVLLLGLNKLLLGLKALLRLHSFKSIVAQNRVELRLGEQADFGFQVCVLGFGCVF